jgi:hypothetical protein
MNSVKMRAVKWLIESTESSLVPLQLWPTKHASAGAEGTKVFDADGESYCTGWYVRYQHKYQS